MNDSPHKMPSPLFALCGAVLLLALLTGGGTHSGYLGDVAAQILSIPLLIGALHAVSDEKSVCKKQARIALIACAICVGIVFIQLFPLPFDVWAGREAFLASGEGTRSSHLQFAWSTLSLTPQATWAAAVSLLVPLSLFSSVMQLGHGQRMLLCRLILAAGAVSLLLGFFQVAQGPESPFRFYGFTNPDDAVGFFANRNHFAAFLNVTLVLSGIWLAQTIEVFMDKRGPGDSSVLWFAVAAAFFIAIVAALVMTRSRSGVLIAIVVLTGVVLMIFLHNRSNLMPVQLGNKKRLGRVSLAVAVFAALFALQFGLGRILDRFQADPTEDLRLPINVTTFTAAFRALPFGTGLGSFVPVYAAAEKPEDTVPWFVNRAHDEFAEFFLETGILGVFLIAAFLVWFGRVFFAVWIKPRSDSPAYDSLLACASSLIILVLLLHSLVDYPLRTTALGALFACFCGILAAPVAPAPRERPVPPQRTHRRPRAGITPITLEKEELPWPPGWRHHDL